MTLDGTSPQSAHTRQTFLLVLLSILVLPLTTTHLFWTLAKTTLVQSRTLSERVRLRSSPGFRPRTFLVTGVGMAKGLALARTFYAAGHDVIGADAEEGRSYAGLTSTCARHSRALTRFHALRKPDGRVWCKEAYARDLLRIVVREHVDVWVSCSGVTRAVEDGYAADLIRRRTLCRVVQFGEDVTRELHEKDSFMAFVASVGLRTPETHFVNSHERVHRVLETIGPGRRRFVLKIVGVDDVARSGTGTLLPCKTPMLTRRFVSSLAISETKPWILQEYIDGQEYCTHALVVDNHVETFVACPSAEMLMHYRALPVDSPLTRSMLRWTQALASRCAPGLTGHLSFDFLVKREHVEAARMGQLENVPLWPIECNPRTHTAVVLFTGMAEVVTNRYLRVLDLPLDLSASEAMDEKSSSPPQRIVDQADPVQPESRQEYHWLPHDFVTLVAMPIVDWTSSSGGLGTVMEGFSAFARLVLSSHDGTFVDWDPVPAWWLWHVSWPLLLLKAWVMGERWSRVNVSTMKMLGC